MARLSVEQKARLLTGADFWTLHDEPAVGLRSLVVSDGPAGVRGQLWDERSTSANLPSPTAIAASWDVDLAERLGGLLAAECRRKGVDVLLAPTVNLHRSPYGGRHFECFSEDPLLTADIGAALVRGLQSHGVGATVKHFVANDSETDRFTADMRVSERVLRELYLAPFEAIVTEARAWAVMAAYNAVNGTTMTQSPMLESVLRGDWGFDGLVMTDWFAGRAVREAAQAGLDLMMPGPDSPWRDGLATAVHQGRVEESVLDAKVVRLLRLAARVGALDLLPDGGGLGISPSQEQVSHQLRAAASSGFVLLRNEPVPAADPAAGRVLPLAADRLARVAMVGPNAARGRTLGGGSALVFPPYTVSPLDGLRTALGDGAEVVTALGVRAHTRLAVAEVELLHVPGEEQSAVEVSFLDNQGAVVFTERRHAAAFNWHGNPIEPIPHPRAVRVDTVLTAPTSGDYLLGASGLGRFVLELDGVPAFDARLSLPEGADFVEALMAPPQHGQVVTLTEGQLVRVALLHEPDPSPHSPDPDFVFQLNLERPYDGDDAEIDRAVALAAGSDVAVVVVGTTEEVESEGFDRTSLALPGRQDELVARVVEANPRTVVVVNAGAPVLLPWREQVPAVLLVWFPGQEFGNALADVLLGGTEPGGRLPTTWPAVEDGTLPSTLPIGGEVDYDEGLDLGHRRFLRDGVEPAYWFGHGLGYTTWRYVSVATAAEPGLVRVSAVVENVGAREGREVVQVYLSRADSAVPRPVRWLAGHAIAQAGPGDQVRVEVELPDRRFAHWDGEDRRWDVEPGPFLLQVGASAEDLLIETVVEPVPH